MGPHEDDASGVDASRQERDVPEGDVASRYGAEVQCRQQEGFLLSYQPDGDGSGLLEARVSFGNFAGECAARAFDEDLIGFGQALLEFPFDVTAPAVELRCGGDVDADHVLLRIRPVGGRGQLACLVHLVAPAADYPGLRPHVVDVELLTTFERLTAFGRALRDLGAPPAEPREAHLAAEVI